MIVMAVLNTINMGCALDMSIVKKISYAQLDLSLDSYLSLPSCHW